MNKYAKAFQERVLPNVITAIKTIDSAFKAEQAGMTLREDTPVIGRYVDTDENLWRPLSSRSDKDLKPVDHAKMLSLAYYVWVLNPMARSIVELKKDYVVGDGLIYKAEDEDVQAWLDLFWEDPVNQWGIKIHNKVRELILYGEQCWPVFVDEFTGMARLGYLDPMNIKEVIVDPMNCETAIGVKWTVGQDEYRARTIIDESVISEQATAMREQYEHGEVFYFAINKLSNATRGLSDLLPILDAVDVLDRLVFNRAEKVEVLSNYWVDVTIAGATQDEVDAFEAGRGAMMPKPGRMNIHNDRINYDVIAPKLESTGFDVDFKLVKNYILAGVGLPEHFFGEGGEVNRATALEMGDPVNKRLRSLQDYVENMMRYIFGYAIQQGKANNAIPQAADEAFTVSFPELAVSDLEKHAKTLQMVTQSLTQLRMDGLISEEHAQSLLTVVFQPFGVELTFEEMEQMAQESWKGYTDLLQSTMKRRRQPQTA